MTELGEPRLRKALTALLDRRLVARDALNRFGDLDVTTGLPPDPQQQLHAVPFCVYAQPISGAR